MSTVTSDFPFPDTPRVIYKKNPIVNVTCQLRFPTILKIVADQKAVASFQECIRQDFPQFEPIQGPNAKSQPPTTDGKLSIEWEFGLQGYNFLSHDGNLVISLTKEFLAVTSKDYKQWEQFRPHVLTALNTLIEEFRPSYITRVGLRYQDVIRRSILGIEDVDWADLLNPAIAGIFTVPGIAGLIDQSFGRSLLKDPANSCNLLIQHGVVLSADEKEECFLIDADIFSADSDNIEVDNVASIIDRFNKNIGRFFRWSISPRLHESMVPHSI